MVDTLGMLEKNKQQIGLGWVVEALDNVSTYENIKKFSHWFAEKVPLSNVIFFSLDLREAAIHATYMLHGCLESGLSVSVQDTNNPICYSLFFGGNYKVSSVEKFPEQSSYRMLLSTLARGQYGYLMPIHINNKPYGIFLFLAKTKLEAPEVFLELQPYVHLFEKVENITVSYKYLEANNIALQQQGVKILEESQKIRAHEALNSLWIGNELYDDRFRREIVQSIRSPLNTVLVGEAGTGKKTIAAFMHQFSGHYAGAYICVDCSQFSKPSDLEVELFGKQPSRAHLKKPNYIGAFERAAHGTLVLLNIHCIFSSIQRKIYKVLHGKIFKPLGGSETTTFEGKFICTAPDNFFDTDHKFHEKFMASIRQRVIAFRSIKENKANTVALANHFLTQYCVAHAKTINPINNSVKQVLCDFHYDENAHTLQQLITAVGDSTGFGESITIEKLKKVYKKVTSAQKKTVLVALKPRLKKYEIRLIQEVILECKGNITQAAKELDLPRRTLTYKCKKLQIGRKNENT